MADMFSSGHRLRSFRRIVGQPFKVLDFVKSSEVYHSLLARFYILVILIDFFAVAKFVFPPSGATVQTVFSYEK